ncbi:MAG TPA: hypothetical protein VFT22_39665 [Kofleriaceae bacterium]|nr:hypothetical protein [Kofleriaceae bacterium]
MIEAAPATRAGRPRLAAVAVLAGLAGCGYRPGSFRWTQGGFAGERATVGCLDVAVERRPDVSIGPVLRYQFANRCDHLATVDLPAAAVVARTDEGAEVALAPYDPGAELRAAALDGRSVGSESLAYPAEGPISQLCVDLAALAHDPTPRWVCVGATPPAAANPAGGGRGASADAVASGAASSGTAVSGAASSGAAARFTATPGGTR